MSSRDSRSCLLPLRLNSAFLFPSGNILQADGVHQTTVFVCAGDILLMRHKAVVLISGVAIGLSLTIGVIAQQAETEAPAAFATPILATNPGSQSVSNGLVEPAGDTFALDQSVFEAVHDASSGLGPMFNANSCATCHANPVAGSASQITEVRVGHLDDNGNFVNPTVTINDATTTVGGRSLINDRATCTQ